MIKPEYLRLALKLILKNWYTLLLLPALGWGIGYLVAYTKPNVYQARTEFLLKADNKYDYQSNLYKGLVGYDAYAKITNQKRVISSYDIVESVVEKLDIDVSYFLVGRLKKQELYRTSPFRVEVETINSALIEKEIGLTFSKDEITFTYIYGGEEVVVSAPITNIIRTQHFSFRLTFNEKGGKKIQASELSNGEYAIVYHSRTRQVNAYRSRLNISGLDYTSILVLKVTDMNQRRALDFLDTLAATYRDYSVRERLNVNRNTVEFIDKQLEEVGDYIVQGELNLESFKKNNKIFNIEAEEQRYLKSLMAKDGELNDEKFKMSVMNDLIQYVKDSETEFLLPPNYYIPEGDSYLNSTVKKLYEMQLGKMQNLYSLKEESPEIERSGKTFELIKRDMLQYLENSKKAIQERINFINSELGGFEVKLRGVPQTQREIINLRRKISVNEKLYDFLTEQRAKITIERSSIVPETEVIDTPRSQGIISPDRASIRNSYLFGGLILAFAIGAIRFLFFDKYETAGELKTHTELTLVGSLPKVKVMPSFSSKEYMDSELAEAVRRVRTNLQFMGLGADKKSVLVSSMYPSEGKTFTSVNIAYLQAFTGKRVMLIDFDLHKPNVHKTVGLKNDKGVSLFLSGKVTELAEIKTAVNSNFDIITTGPIPPNASELILNDRLGELLTEVKRDYDIVILDTPPLHLITDAKVLMEHSDINLLVMNARRATRNNLIDIEQFQEEFQVPNFGLILNGVKISRWQYMYAKYDYKYAYKYGDINLGYGYKGYGYGYGYGNKGEA